MKLPLRLGTLALAAFGLVAQSTCSSPDPPAGAGGASSTTSGSSSSTSSTSSTSTSSSISSSSTSTSSSASTSSSTSTSTSTSSSSAGGPLPQKFTVTGVVTDGKNPLPGAYVMQGGGTFPIPVTGADGTYSIELDQAIPGTPTVVAGKLGYRQAGVEFLTDSDIAGPVELALRFAAPPDNTAYVFGDPGTGDPAHDTSTLFCGHCHATMAKEFQLSGHARATKNPVVQDLYAGVTEAYATQASCLAAGGAWRAGLVPGTASTSASKCYVGGGVLPDLNPGCAGALACDDPALPPAKKPSAFGRCADCHAPGIDGVAGGRSLHEAVGIAFDNGNHCDVCHHARDVDLTKPPGVAGALVLQRPSEHKNGQPGAELVQVLFGPSPDVPNPFMGGSYQPVFGTASVCGACHEQKQESLVPGQTLDPARWPNGLPTHSTYSEWSDGPYDTPGTPCQFCHMPADDTGLKSSIDDANGSNAGVTFGFVRPPKDLHQHSFRDPLQGSPRFIDGAVSISLSTSTSATDITATIVLQNVKAGHAIPTGEPMRALLLVVQGDACGSALVPSGGMTLNDIGGAAAQGSVGADVSFAGTTATWAAGAAAAKPGDVVRVVRPTGSYDDYAGVGFFANPALTPSQKGLELRAPVGEAKVLSVNGAALALSAALAVQNGDLVYLGDAQPAAVSDGDAARALAGGSGYSFARTLVDGAGARNVPHYRAVDIVSDNRIGPTAKAATTHSFASPMGCASATLTATVLYRPLPLGLSRQRGWSAKDYVVAKASQTVALP